MQTHWGELAVRDAHVHFFSHQFFALLTGGRPVDEVAAQLAWEAPPESPELLADRWVAELDRHGVAAASLIASMPGDERSVELAVARHPERLYGQFLVNPLAPNALERVAACPLRTICLFPAMHRYSVADERLDALWPLAHGRNAHGACDGTRTSAPRAVHSSAVRCRERSYCMWLRLTRSTPRSWVLACRLPAARPDRARARHEPTARSRRRQPRRGARSWRGCTALVRRLFQTE